MKYCDETAKDMSGRVWALTQVGKFLGVGAMLGQVKVEEKEDLKAWLGRFYRNTNGMPQEIEMKHWEYQQKAAEFGWEYINALWNTVWEA